MKTSKIKSINFLSGVPQNIFDDFVDILVTLEDDDNLKYWFEVTTSHALAFYMDKKNKGL